MTERVGETGKGPEIDGRAMTTHLEELVGSDIDSVKIWNTAETEFSRIEYVLGLLGSRASWAINIWLLCICFTNGT